MRRRSSATPTSLVLLRDPVQRALSNWRFSTDHGLETRPVEEALRADLDGEQPWDPAATSVSPFAYVRRGRYADHLPPWTSTFPGLDPRGVPRGAAVGPGVLTDLVGGSASTPT